MAKRHAEGPYTRERTSRSYRREKEVLPATVFYTKRTLFQLKFFFLPDKIGKDAHPEYAASIMAEEPDIFMTLRKKSLLIILFSMTAFLATTLGVSRALMLSGYEELEQLLLARNVERATNAIVHRIEGLERLVLDWAPWDDTYEFAKDFNEEYIRNNLLPETLDNLDLAVFAILPYSKEPFFFGKGARRPPSTASPSSNAPESSSSNGRASTEQADSSLKTARSDTSPQRPFYEATVPARPAERSDFSGYCRRRTLRISWRRR